MSTETAAPIEPIKPAKTALLVMDMQNGILPRLDTAEALIAATKDTIALAREKGLTVGYVRVGFADGELESAPPTSGMAKRLGGASATMMHADHENTQVHDQLKPQDGDIVVRKSRVGPFGTTDLHEQLAARGIDTLILTGISTSGVVLSTVRDGYDRDFRLIVISDLVADPEPDVHDVLIERIFPRQAEVITAAELAELLD
jgi:nicotinamidase-related amidase